MQLKHLLFFIVASLAITCNIYGQLCQGSLGDPVVNITFGTGSGTIKPFPLTKYSFVSHDCPNDGSYTLINQTNNCFNSTWHSLSEDHTPGDNNGLMMLINASFDTGAFYIDTIRNLCPNTTYEFAAWVINVLRPVACGGFGIKPNLTFRIEKTDGTLIKKYDSGDIPAPSSPTWNQYGFFFTSAPGDDKVVIRLTNNAPGGCGNDLALDDITFRPCGPSVNVSITGSNNKDSIDFCEGANPGPLNLAGVVSSGYNNPALQWQLSSDGGATYTDINNATGNTYSSNVTGAGSYIYRLAVAEAGNLNSPACRINSNIVKLNINPLPVTSAQSNSPVCGSADLMLTATGGTTYHWNGPNNFSSAQNSPVIQNPSQAYAGEFYVNVTSDKGCSKKDSVNVGIFPSPVANAGNDVTICEGTSTILKGSGGISSEWSPVTGLSSPNNDETSASPKDTTTYTLTVKDGNGCKAKDSVIVNVLSKPSADAGPNKVILEGQSVQLQGSAGGDSIAYAWSPPANITNANTLQPTVSPVQDATYTLVVSSKAGCGAAYDNVFVRVFKKVIVPNAFSPNGDGINDTWVMDAIETYPECEVQVFNRYGQTVFISKGYNKKWDGTYNSKPLPVAAYYYVINLDPLLPKLSGWVMILR